MSSIDRKRASELVKSGKPYQSCCGVEVGTPHIPECVNFKAVLPPEHCEECGMIGFHRPQCANRTTDAINPKHYEHPSGVETIQVNRCMTFDVGNGFKYVLRAGQKDTIDQDLKKARWYLADAIENEDPIWISSTHRWIGQPLLEKIVKFETGYRASIYVALLDLDLNSAATALDIWRGELATA